MASPAASNPPDLPRRIVLVTTTPHGVELYFPPLRGVVSALMLGIFGLIATGIGSIGAAALLPGAAGHTTGLMGAVLLATFVLPFCAFGIAFVMLALYMALSGLAVSVTREGVVTRRALFGAAFGKRRIAASDIASIEPQIASRDQSPFASEPVFRLVAIDATRTRRLVVAESLEGEAMMQQVKTLIEERISA